MLSLLLVPYLLLSLAATTKESLGAVSSDLEKKAEGIKIPSNWVEYTPGTCNVVISSPHGGTLRASEIPDRTDGCLGSNGVTCRWEKACSPGNSALCRAVTGMDTNTQQVAALIVRHLKEKYNCSPHFIRSNLHRSKLDPNRPIEEAAQGDPLSEAAWRAYHENYMVTAVESVRSRFGKGLVFDIHGQAHAEQWTELGYVLSKAELNAGPQNLKASSIRGLAERTGLSPSELLSGRRSLGALLESAGYKMVPSSTYPSPGSGNYFSGGYITQRYGSRVSGQVDAIQVEIASGIRLNQVALEKFAADLAREIDQFRRLFGYDV